LAFVQTAGLVHSHDGELQTQFDCEICLKAGSDNDIALNTSQAFVFESSSYNLVEQLETTPLSRAIPAKSRSPPLS